MSGLKASQERLLQRYRDGEAGFFIRRRAERLLERNEAAFEYYESLSFFSTDLCKACWPDKEIDLWSRIDRVIENEERSELYLGKRQPAVEPARMPFLPQLGWGVSGAALASVLFAVFLVPTYQQSSSSSSGQSASRAASGASFSQVAARAGSAGGVALDESYFSSDQLSGGANVTFASTAPKPVHLRSIRTQGRSVRVHHDQSDGGAVMWIRRPDANAKGRRKLIFLKRRTDVAGQDITRQERRRLSGAAARDLSSQSDRLLP